MLETTYRLYDTLIKAITIIFVMIGSYNGYHQFMMEWELNNRKPYLEIRTKVYQELVETVSKITYSGSEEKKKESIIKFWQLYVGLSSIVEDGQVESAVNDFSTCLNAEWITKHTINSNKSEESNLTPTLCIQTDLEVKAQILSSKIRQSLLESWQIKGDFDTIKNNI